MWDEPEDSARSGLGDQLGQREEALSLVLKVLQAVEIWVQTLQREEVGLARGTLEIARQVEAQDVQADEKGKVSLIKGVAKNRRMSVEDAEMRHGRKSRSVRVDGYKRHVRARTGYGSHPSSGHHASQHT